MAAAADGRRLGAFGLTEPDAGSDAGNTKHPREPGRRRVGDRRREAVHHERRHRHLGVVTITAVTGEEDGRREISNLLVPNGTPGLEVGEPYRKMGWNASDTRPLAFSGCRVPRRTCSAGAAPAFASSSRCSTSAGSASPRWASGSPRARSTRHSRTRRNASAFGRPICKFQAIQAKLADMSTEIEAVRLLTYKAAWLKDQGRPFSLAAAQAKLKSGLVALHAVDEAVQIHGGYGFIEEYPVCRFYRDAKILTIGEGTDEIQRMVIARALGA